MFSYVKSQLIEHSLRFFEIELNRSCFTDGGYFAPNLFTPRYFPCKKMALGHRTKFIVVVPKHILRVAKMGAKIFPCKFLVSCKFFVGEWVVVVVGRFTAAIKITIVTDNSIYLHYNLTWIIKTRVEAYLTSFKSL